MNLSLAFVRGQDRLSPLPVDPAQQVDIPGIGTLGYRSSRGETGPALVFVHGAKVSSGPHELRALREAFAERPTYALDWPGYGASSFPARGVNAHHAARALVAFIEQVVPPEQRPVDVVALSRGCEFAARAALRQPEVVRSLAFLSPTGFGAARSSPKLAQLMRELRRSPQLSELLFRTLTSMPVLLCSLLNSVDGKTASSLAKQAHHAARQPGARLAPFTFLEEALAGQIAGVSLYQALRVPTFVLFDQDPHSSFELLPALTHDNAFVRALRLESRRGVPHLESFVVVERALREYYQAMSVAERFEDWESTVETVPFSRSSFRAA